MPSKRPSSALPYNFPGRQQNPIISLFLLAPPLRFSPPFSSVNVVCRPPKPSVTSVN